MKIAIYPGTFDPITYGHIDVISRASRIFDKVVVAVMKNPSKIPLFSAVERADMINVVVRKFGNVEVDSFEGLLVDYLQKKKATIIVRGLRAISDFEYEFQMALMNRKLNDKFTTVFLMPHEKYTYLNSSIVREIAKFGGSVSGFVPPVIRKKLEHKIKSIKLKQ